jgi:putative DNA primase/helicase
VLDPVPVRLLEDTGLRYTAEEIEEVLPDEEAGGEVTNADRRVWTGSATPRAALDRILAGCAYLRHCRDDAATLDEPSWHAMLTVVARCRDGSNHAHALSKPYPAYDPDETDSKFAYAVKANKPLRCATIRTKRGGERFCATCPHWGRIPGPLVLGYAPSGEPKVGRMARPGRGPLRPGKGAIRVG